MKKTYVKPDAEYIDLVPTDILTGVGVDGEMGDMILSDEQDW